MYEDVFILAIIFSFAGLVCTGVYRLVMVKMRKDTGIDEETFERLAKAFIEHKKDMQKRVKNLEAIIADGSNKDGYPQIEEPRSENTLTNDLDQKKRVKS